MAKRSTGWSEEKFKRYIKEGRGQGEGKGYKPWLSIQDFPSKGRATRVLGLSSKRMHSFFSDIETKCFYLYDWNPNIIDVREHYPLLEIEDVIKDKRDINFNIFKDKETGYPYVLTTTFILTVKDRDGNKKLIARSVKSSSELDKKTTMEKLEIERRYWTSKNINWGIITQKDIPSEKVKNIEWVHSSLHNYEDFNLTEKEMVELSSSFLDAAENSDKALRVFTKEFDMRTNQKLGTGLYIFKYLIAARIIEVNMEQSIDLNATYRELINQVENKR